MHVFDPEDPTFDEIEQLFEQGETPRVILVEGKERLRFSADIEIYRKALTPLTSLSRSELIERHGEAGFGIYLSLRHGIPVFSPEPPYAEELKHICSLGFHRDHIFIAYHARLIYQYRMQDKDQSLSEYLKPHLEDFAVASGWENYDFSFEHFMRLSLQMWPFIKSFDDLDDRAVIDIMAPNTSSRSPLYSPVNVISKEEMAYRDACILNDAIQMVRTCNHVLVIYGWCHLAALEGPLTNAFGKCFDNETEKEKEKATK